MNPQTDIIVPVHNALEYVQPCMDTLFRHTKNVRLIIVDDYSQPETTAYLLGVMQRQPESVFIRTGSQRWFTRASNLGLREVRTQRAVLLNSDCVVDEGWLEELYAVWEEAEKLGARVGLVGSTLSAEEPRRWAEYKEPGYVTGHAWLCSIPIMSEMSERRGMSGWYLSEVDNGQIHIASDRMFCWELNRVGYATIASFKSAVGHHGGKSWGYDLGRISRLRSEDPLKGTVIG
jgi:glycosyltransferase involved in cell wall biosynthesis